MSCPVSACCSNLSYPWNGIFLPVAMILCRTVKQPLGWTLPTFSWYIDQTIAGAISTATHGSTLKYGSMSNLVSTYASSLNGLLSCEHVHRGRASWLLAIHPSQQVEAQRPEETAVGNQKFDGTATSIKPTARPVTALRGKIHHKFLG